MSQSNTTTPPSSEKLQKVLARAGLGSRREMETAIADGRVKVNSQVAKLGDEVERVGCSRTLVVCTPGRG